MKYEELQTFSKYIKSLRKQSHLTQKQMAELLGCTEGHFQKIEYGNVNLCTTDLIFLADYFGVSIDYLVGRCDNPQSHKL